MSKTIAAALASALALAGATAALATHKPGHPAKPAQAQGKSKAQQSKGTKKVEICHRTNSTKKKSHTIRVSERAVPAHMAHGDSEGACTNGPQGTQPRGFKRLTTQLTTANGATTGSGSAIVDVRVTKRSARVCYTLNVTGVDATAAHIHTATALTAGSQTFAANDIVVPLKTPNDQGVSRGCVKVSKEIGQAILANPSSFYVNVHSAAFPAGQVSGTLTTS